MVNQDGGDKETKDNNGTNDKKKKKKKKDNDTHPTQQRMTKTSRH